MTNTNGETVELLEKLYDAGSAAGWMSAVADATDVELDPNDRVKWVTRISEALAALAQQPAVAPSAQSQAPTEGRAVELAIEGLCEWAVGCWNDEVKHRPIVNVHRRTLDDTWRQVIRQLGGDPVVLLGPSHDDLRAEMTTNEYLAAAGQEAVAAEPPAAIVRVKLDPESGEYLSDTAPPAAAPGAFTGAQIRAGWEATFSTNNPFCPCDLRSFTKAVRWAESIAAARAAGRAG